MQRLQEKFTISKETVKKLPLTEGLEIEEKDGKKLKCRAAYEIPVWRLDEKNLNNRVYSSKLAEKVIKETNTTLGLANHPENEADVTMTFAVEKNPHIKEKVLYVDAYFVGQHGELAKEIIEAGGEIGLSSSALGDVDDKGNVLTEGFIVERYADWVDNPSYQVFVGRDGSLEGKLKKESKDFKENNTNIKDIKENLTVDNKLEFISTNIVEKKENKKMSTKDNTLTIEEKNLRLGVKNLFEKAESKEDLQEKVDAYQEVIEYCDGVDIAEDYVKEASEKISEIQKEIYELANKGKKLDQIKESSEKTLNETKEELNKLKEDHELLAEKYDRAVELLEKMKEREKKLKELYEVALAEKNGMVTAEEYKELQVFTESKEEEIEELKEEVSKLKKRLKKYVEQKVGTKEKPSQKQEAEDEKDKDKDKKKKKDDDDEDMEPEDEKGDVKNDEEMEEEIFDFRNNKDVERYYEDLVEENPNVEKIKDDILKCKTLFEAQRKYLTLRDLVEEDYSPSYAKQVHLEEEEEKPKNQRNFNLNIREGWL